MSATTNLPIAGPVISLGQFSQAGRKDRNDDSYGVLIPSMPLLASKGIAMAIADGMSSSEGAKEASESCVKSFLEDYFCTAESWTVQKSVAAVLKAINSWLYAQGQARHGSDRGMVTTFSGMVLKAGTAHVFHAGDSRIGRLRDGALEPLTRDHHVRVGARKTYLARALGADINLEIDYRAEAVEPGDIFIFSTDGVHEHVPPARMLALIDAASGDLAAASRAIVNHAYDQGSADNLTCQIVRVDATGAIDAETHLRALTALPFPPELEPGSRFEGYRVLRALHLSKRTQVYLAEETATGQAVVLKTPSRNFEDDPAYLEMFAREERIGRLVANPNVLSVLSPAQPRRFLYYATEYFDGQTLRQWMRDHPAPDLASVRAIVAQIAKGLRAFHRKQVIHQDLKPENIMIDRFGTVKIIDFGSASAAGFDEGMPIAAQGIDRPDLLGTINYTAPEYHRGEPPHVRADLYSLGVITYEMLTGRLPYGKGFTSWRDAERRHYIQAIQVREDIPIWLDAALAKAVAKQPEARTGELSEFLTDLERPNADLVYNRARPLIERNPVAFWRAVAIALVLADLAIAVWFLR